MREQKNNQPSIGVKLTLTEGYEQRFTKAILKIYEKRIQKENKQQKEAG